MIAMTVYHENDRSMYIKKIYDTDTKEILSEFNDEIGKIDFSPLQSHVGETIKIEHMVERKNMTHYIDESKTGYITLENIDTEDNIRYIAYSMQDKEGRE